MTGEESHPTLPAGWAWTTFSVAASIASNLVDPTNWQDHPHIAPDNIERDTGRLLPYRSIREDGVTSPKHLFRAGQLLYSKIRPYLNKCVKVDFGGLCSADMYPLDANIDPGFLLFSILSKRFVSAVSKAAGSRTILPKTNQEQLADVAIPVPPLPEQRRIVAKIEELFTCLDAGVAGLKRAKALLKRYRASVLKAACEGRLVPTEAELARQEGRSYEPAAVLLQHILTERRKKWEQNGKKGRYVEPAAPDTGGLPELPEGWVWTTVEQCAAALPGAIQSGPFGSQLLHSEFQDTGVLAVGIDNVLDGQFSKGSQNRIPIPTYQRLKKFEARPGDVLITVMATVGRCCVLPEDVETAIITKHVYRISVDKQFIHPRFLMQALRGGTEVRKQLSGGVRGQTRPGINGTILKGLAVPLPPLAEQHRIVAEVERLLSLADNLDVTLTKHLTQSDRLRQSILKRAFEGKLVPQDPTDEPASVLLERIRKEREAQPTTKKPRRRVS